jgi:hypothetical protein
MKVFRKYQFGSKGSATTKINALGIDEEGNPTHSHAIVRLGNLVVTPAEIDEEGNVITEAVLSDTYHVDILWDGEPNPDWDAQLVWCAPMGVHTFGSSSAIAEWTETCKSLHPEYFPEPSEEML